jgi:hypothetical protein
VAVIPLGEDVAVYDEIALPPLFFGYVKVMLACPAIVAVAVPIIGASGTVPGVADLEETDSIPVPTAFVASTLKV